MPFSRSLKAHILLVLVTLVWGATFVVIKNALAEISPLLFNAVRMTLASAVLCLLFRKELARFTAASLRAGILVGVFLWAGYELQTTGLALTTPSKSAFLTGISVVLVPVFLALAFRQRLNRRMALGVASALTGLYWLTVPRGANLFGGLAAVNAGDLLTLACAVAFAWQIIFLGRATREHGFRQMAILQTATAALLMVLSAPVLETPRALWSPQVIWAVLITSMLATAAAFTIQAWAQQFTPATHTALIFSLEPVFAWLTSYLVLREKLGGRATLGALLILAGLLIAEIRGGALPGSGVAAAAPETERM